LPVVSGRKTVYQGNAIVAKKSRFPPERLKTYLKKHLGEKIYLNADNRRPNVLKEIHEDYIVLSAVPKETEPEQSFVVPISSIVSLQQVEGIDGLVVYLVR
jgi:hypothetical protein